MTSQSQRPQRSTGGGGGTGLGAGQGVDGERDDDRKQDGGCVSMCGKSGRGEGERTGERDGETVRDSVWDGERGRGRESHSGVNDWSCAPLLYAPDGVH